MFQLPSPPVKSSVKRLAHPTFTVVLTVSFVLIESQARAVAIAIGVRPEAEGDHANTAVVSDIPGASVGIYKVDPYWAPLTKNFTGIFVCVAEPTFVTLAFIG
jgi:hypothetical protein